MKQVRAVLVAFILIYSLPNLCVADTADVLPKGVFLFDATYYHYFNIHKRYNPDGDSEDIDRDYNTELDSTVFPALAPLDALLGQTASIGRSVVDFYWQYRWFEFTLNYGITDKLTAYVLLPYNYSKNNISSRVDTSTANVGKNPLYGTPEDPFQSPIIPLSMGGIPFEKNDVLDLLGGGLDVNNDGTPDVPGFGYKRYETWSDSGIGDIEIMGKYQFFKNEAWRLAGLAGVRLPTGEADDPDMLQDLPFGDGNTDLLFRINADYTGIPKLVLNGTVRYDIQLPDEEKMRVLEDVNFPLTANKETVDRNLGDIIEFEVMGNYSLTKEISGGAKYRYTKKFKDSIDGDLGYNYSALEEETDSSGHMIFISLGYSTVSKYLEKKFAVPFYANLEYRYRFAGTNNSTRSQFVSFNAGVFF